MGASAPRRNYSFEDDLGVEEMSSVRHEYLDGEALRPRDQIPSLRAYALVSQDRRRIEAFRRAAGRHGTLHVAGPGERVELPSVNVASSVDELYDAAGL